VFYLSTSSSSALLLLHCAARNPLGCYLRWTTRVYYCYYRLLLLLLLQN
jgi:hypothetical protein